MLYVQFCDFRVASLLTLGPFDLAWKAIGRGTVGGERKTSPFNSWLVMDPHFEVLASKRPHAGTCFGVLALVEWGCKKENNALKDLFQGHGNLASSLDDCLLVGALLSHQAS